MTDEKIISFARMIRDGGHWHQLDLINFARMIETHLSYASIHSCGPACDRPACVNVRRAVEREREECAKCVEDEIKRIKPVYSVTAENALKAIRARGKV
jgi:hypothetical protein